MTDSELNDRLSEGFRLLDMWWNDESKRDSILSNIKELIDFYQKEKANAEGDLKK